MDKPLKLSPYDMQYLRLAAATCLASLCIGAAFAWQAGAYLERARASLLQAQQQRETAHHKLIAIRADSSNISSYLSEYRRLLEHKIIASDQTLDWIKVLAALRRQQHAIAFQYSVSAQQAYRLSTATTNDYFATKLNRLHLQIELLHEAQLLALLNAIGAQGKGWFMLDTCTIERYARAAEPANKLAQLHAECDGGWITLHPIARP